MVNIKKYLLKVKEERDRKIPNEITAKSAYLRTIYPYEMTEDDLKRVKIFLRSVHDTISDYIHFKEQQCIRVIPDDIRDYENDIVQYLTNLGYSVTFLDRAGQHKKVKLMLIEW